jgi:hypothetical protein
MADCSMGLGSPKLVIAKEQPKEQENRGRRIEQKKNRGEE